MDRRADTARGRMNKASDLSKTYAIEGMHCNACARRIGEALSGLGFEASVTLHPPRLTLRGSSLPEEASVAAALSLAGDYRLAPLPPTEEGEQEGPQDPLTVYRPLLLILTLLALVAFAGAANAHDWMLNFMAGFFIAFGFFKLLDLRGFADAYAGYDLLAARVRPYAYAYPFLELALGFAFLFRFELNVALWASLALMLFGSLGVIRALGQKKKIRCACLGTVLNLPMSTVTLIEDLGMAAMAVFMLV